MNYLGQLEYPSTGRQPGRNAKDREPLHKQDYQTGNGNHRHTKRLGRPILASQGYFDSSKWDGDPNNLWRCSQHCNIPEEDGRKAWKQRGRIVQQVDTGTHSSWDAMVLNSDTPDFAQFVQSSSTFQVSTDLESGGDNRRRPKGKRELEKLVKTKALVRE
ncbi:hypothetical protein B0H13DRAFT_1871196 [Mycena leptocephala]|nr:hypothetical protein B0H13DRAFT_1871196 [Mycena leptocephala]